MSIWEGDAFRDIVSEPVRRLRVPQMITALMTRTRKRINPVPAGEQDDEPGYDNAEGHKRVGRHVHKRAADIEIAFPAC